MRTRSLLALAPLIALVGCNGADDGKADATGASASAVASAPASPPQQTPDPAPTTTAPAPEAPSQAPAAEQARPAAPAGHPAVGTWQSPLKNGKRAYMSIRSDGGLQLNTGGFVCSGRATPNARTFQIRVTQCVAPIPVVVGTVSPDGKSMTVVETKPSGKKSTEKWRRLLS